MIYSTTLDKFPVAGQFSECHEYQDENDFAWKIARVKNGFFVAYFGTVYFKEKYLDVQVVGKSILINNTGCFFVNDTDFDTFYSFRKMLKEGYTDDIWESIEQLISERLKHDPTLMLCEIPTPIKSI